MFLRATDLEVGPTKSRVTDHLPLALVDFHKLHFGIKKVAVWEQFPRLGYGVSAQMWLFGSIWIRLARGSPRVSRGIFASLILGPGVPTIHRMGRFRTIVVSFTRS